MEQNKNEYREDAEHQHGFTAGMVWIVGIAIGVLTLVTGAFLLIRYLLR